MSFVFESIAASRCFVNLVVIFLCRFLVVSWLLLCFFVSCGIVSELSFSVRVYSLGCGKCECRTRFEERRSFGFAAAACGFARE